jgi:hypothetical protein
MADLTPAEKYALGAKYKKAGIIVATIGAIVVAIGGSLWGYGEHLQIQAVAEAKASGWGYLTVRDASGKVIEGLVLDESGRPALNAHGDLVCRKSGMDAPCPLPPVPLGGGASGAGGAR